MSNHLLVEIHKSFRAASKSARSLSDLSGVATTVRRVEAAWGVFGDENHKSVIDEASQEALADAEQIEQEDDHETWLRKEEAKYIEHEVLGPLREERLSDLDDHERSTEDGWMYGD